MSDLPWRDLIRLGLCELRLDPDVFWRLTPAELLLLSGNDGHGTAVTGTERLRELMTLFPDTETSRHD